MDGAPPLPGRGLTGISGRGHGVLDIADGVFAVVEDRGGKHRVGAAGEGLDEGGPEKPPRRMRRRAPARPVTRAPSSSVS